MKDIKVSFVIPVYNTLIKEFESCISSILAVKDIRFEIIVIDDGSQETCAEAYRMYLKKLADERVRLIRQENQGVSAARNKGIENATGVYIMFVDSDDTLYSEKFKPYCGIADIVI